MRFPEKDWNPVLVMHCKTAAGVIDDKSLHKAGFSVACKWLNELHWNQFALITGLKKFRKLNDNSIQRIHLEEYKLEMG